MLSHITIYDFIRNTAHCSVYGNLYIASCVYLFIYVICMSSRKGTTYTCKKTKVRNKHLYWDW